MLQDETKISAIEADYTRAPLTVRERAILDYASRLTRTPAQMTEDDVAVLREAGLGDDEILDTCQVTAYYNYVNRIASGLGVELEGYWASTTEQP